MISLLCELSRLLFPNSKESRSHPCMGETRYNPKKQTKLGNADRRKCIIMEYQFSSVTQSWPTLCDPMNCSRPGLPVHHHLPEFTQTHVHLVGDAIQLSHSLSSPFPPAPNPSQHQSLFQWVNLHMRWPKYWSFSFSIFPSKAHPGLISFRMDWEKEILSFATMWMNLEDWVK